MKTDDVIKEAMDEIQNNLTKSNHDETISLQGQYAIATAILNKQLDTEEKIKDTMKYIKEQLTTSSAEKTILLQGQYAFAEWILSEDKEERKDGFADE